MVIVWVPGMTGNHRSAEEVCILSYVTLNEYDTLHEYIDAKTQETETTVGSLVSFLDLWGISRYGVQPSVA